jgi:hypothetical protein
LALRSAFKIELLSKSGTGTKLKELMGSLELVLLRTMRVVQVLGLKRIPLVKHLIPQAASSKTVLIDCRAS